MELKYEIGADREEPRSDHRLNRTFMELKFRGRVLLWDDYKS